MTSLGGGSFRRGLPRARRRRSSEGNYMRMTLLVLAQLFAILICPVSALLRSDIPPNTDSRTLTRLAIPRTYPLSNATLASMPQDQLRILRKDDYALLAFTTTGLERKNVRRAVITLHGQGRDAWSYFDWTYAALQNAVSDGSAISDEDRSKLDMSQTLILAPMFTNEDDADITENLNTLQFDDVSDMSVYDAVPAETSLQWSGGQWSEGGDTIAPTEITYDDTGLHPPVSAPTLSSYEALDAIIAQLSDKSQYPHLDTIVVAGHSMGGQIAQRYALIGAVPSRAASVHFVVANPGSFAYLTNERPYSTKACNDTYDSWKFGLGIYGMRYLGAIVRQSLDSSDDLTDVRVRYLRDRTVHYLYGLDDHGLGDIRCEAVTQGKTHLQRGRRFERHISKVSSSLNIRLAHTTEYVPGVSHDPLGMFTSAAGISRVFLSNIDGDELPSGTGYADADFASYPYRFQMGASARIAPRIYHALALSLVSLASLLLGA